MVLHTCEWVVVDIDCSWNTNQITAHVEECSQCQRRRYVLTEYGRRIVDAGYDLYPSDAYVIYSHMTA